MPSSITSRPSSRPSTPEPVSSPSSPSAPSPQGLTVGERMKRRKAANRKRKAKRATSSSSSSAKGKASNIESSDNTPSTPSRRTTPPSVYEDSDDGVESEADIGMATTPLNLGRKRRFSDSTASRSPSPSPSPSPAKNNKPHKSTKSAVAEKRKVVDSDDESDKENSRPSKKQKGASAPNTNESDLEYSPNEVDLDTDTGILTPKARKGVNKDNDADSDSEFAPSPKKPTRKTGTKMNTKQKKPAPKKGNKRTKNTYALEDAASPKKVMKILKGVEIKPKNARHIAWEKELAKEKKGLPSEYKNTKWLAAEVDVFCMEKGIGHFDEMDRAQQLRLLKEVRMCHEYKCLLNLQNVATKAKNRESNAWKKRDGQGLSSTSGKFVHDNTMTLRQRELDDATRAVDAWEGKDGHITYVVAYNAKYPARAKKYGINESHGPEMMARRAKFFAGPLPVEAWEKRVSDDAAGSSGSAESSDSSGVQACADRLNAAKSGNKKPVAASAGESAAGVSATGASDAEVDDRSPFARVDPATAMKLCPFIFKGIARIEVSEKESDDAEGGSEQPELTIKAFDANDKAIDVDETDVEFRRACATYILRSLESLVGAPMGSLDKSYVAILTGIKTNALLERVKRKIGEVYDLDKEMQSSTWLSVAINEFEPFELPMELLKAMTALSDMGEAPVV